MVQIIEEAWRAYKEEGVRPFATPVEIDECRRAYHAGALTVLTKIVAQAARSQSPEGSVELLAALDDELDRFSRAVGEGRA